MDWKQINKTLCEMIRPQTVALGLKIVAPGTTLPEAATRPARYGIQVSACQWFTLARRWNRVAGLTAEDVNCSPCLAALGWMAGADSDDLADYFMDMGYFASIDRARDAAVAMAPIPAGKLGGLVIFPLDHAVVEPDLVLVYGSPAQMSRLAAGYAYHSGELVRSTVPGFGFSCLSAIRPFVTGKPAMVLPGRGERILAGTEEGEMCFSLPARSMEALADGLEKTHEKGSRYPVQRYVLFQPPVLGPMKTLRAKLRGKEERGAGGVDPADPRL